MIKANIITPKISAGLCDCVEKQDNEEEACSEEPGKEAWKGVVCIEQEANEVKDLPVKHEIYALTLHGRDTLCAEERGCYLWPCIIRFYFIS